MRKAVFLDKDGTLIEDVPYNCDLTRIKLLPGAVEGLQALHAAGYALVVISNQAGVAHGFLTEQFLAAVETRLRALLSAAGVPLDGFFYCPHHPDGAMPKYAVRCTCRKPKPGLILRAASQLKIDPTRSWMVGDILHDVEAGRGAGCRTVLIDNGNETEWQVSDMRWPDHIAKDLAEASDIILSHDGTLEQSSSPRHDRLGDTYAC
ncbi:MAG TPA: HAD family hydrolase [Nitrospiraceae bacterium]|nr:HAD family hydrolase [Nitrospiraceae bacterium]